MTNHAANSLPDYHSSSTPTPPPLTWQTLAEFTLPSELSSEHLALERVAEAV